MSGLITLVLQLIELLRQVPHRLRLAVYLALTVIAAAALAVVCIPVTRSWFGLEHLPPGTVILIGVLNFLVTLSGALASANTKPAAATHTRRVRPTPRT